MGDASLSRDTTRRAERMQVELWRRMSPLEKLRAASEMTRTVVQLAEVGIRQRHPDATEAERKLRLARLMLGPELAARAYPESAALSER